MDIEEWERMMYYGCFDYEISNLGRIRNKKGRIFNEEWKPIEHYNYEISNLGRVKSKSGKILELKMNRKGEYVLASKPTLTVARLVAMAFVYKPNGADHLIHINRIVSDNRWFNLEWVNMFDYIENECKYHYKIK